MKRLVVALLTLALWPAGAGASGDPHMAFIQQQIAARAGQSGVYVLDTGTEALIARAWLADHAQHTIEVQYFIWSTDNIGILAAEALLRAAERGVRVRVIVDDLLIDAPDKSLLALAQHPNIEIRIYNPKHSVGTPLYKRLLNLLTDFRGINQRMHDKTFIVDGSVAITGGRNMAAEYYDYDQAYNFRDRDALLLGAAVKTMQASFENFWASELSAPLEDLYDGRGFLETQVRVSADEVQAAYRGLHDYAAAPANFEPQVHAAIEVAPAAFPRLAREVVWGEATFISDRPGKNEGDAGLGGGGLTTSVLAELIGRAREEVMIQSPYLVLSDKALGLFRRALARGVRVRVSTNSLASTDNIHAFSGYRNQRDELLAMGMEIFEYKPDPEIQLRLMQRIGATAARPVFAVHAKTLVIDGETAGIGTFNLDPRSENLNTEVGVIIRNAALAQKVRAAIEADMSPANSWNAAEDEPDQYVSLGKRSKLRFWQLMPLRPLL